MINTVHTTAHAAAQQRCAPPPKVFGLSTSRRGFLLAPAHHMSVSTILSIAPAAPVLNNNNNNNNKNNTTAACFCAVHRPRAGREWLGLVHHVPRDSKDQARALGRRERIGPNDDGGAGAADTANGAAAPAGPGTPRPAVEGTIAPRGGTGAVGARGGLRPATDAELAGGGSGGACDDGIVVWEKADGGGAGEAVIAGDTDSNMLAASRSSNTCD